MYYDSLIVRIDELQMIFNELQSTNSRLEKEDIIKTIPNTLLEDFNYILECLAGKHKFGYKYYILHSKKEDFKSEVVKDTWTVKQLLEFLQTPMIEQDLTEVNIYFFVSNTLEYAEFLEPIVNRTLRLGIGQSILPKDGLSPMLAKKYEGTLKFSNMGYFITEKLDGNRCIARYDGERWIFTSRNGKEMYVDFDMSGLPTEFVYDGEILSPIQVKMSEEIYNCIKAGLDYCGTYNNAFNNTSGLINTHNKDKQLVYNIFDIMIDNKSYYERRIQLNKLEPLSNNVRILPVLEHYSTTERLNEEIGNILNKVVEIGGEGVMINLGSALYTHKRTDNLLKLKQVQSMDMYVDDIVLGNGKYDGLVGALIASIRTDDDKIIMCKVGSGLSDEQRTEWSIHPERIISKIIEVSYFSLSQDSAMRNTNIYSLRFPRLTKIREDKNTTSEY